MLINQFFLEITLLGVISSFQEIENPQLKIWRHGELLQYHQISLEPKYEKLNRSGESESDFWNLQFLPPTRRLSIVS